MGQKDGQCYTRESLISSGQTRMRVSESWLWLTIMTSGQMRENSRRTSRKIWAGSNLMRVAGSARESMRVHESFRPNERARVWTLNNSHTHLARALKQSVFACLARALRVKPVKCTNKTRSHNLVLLFLEMLLFPASLSIKWRHCAYYFFSAGVGRTGSFIAIDSLMEQMETEKVVDVFGFVAQMRKQRNYMVQTEVSWNSVYKILIIHVRMRLYKPPNIPK